MRPGERQCGGLVGRCKRSQGDDGIVRAVVAAQGGAELALRVGGFRVQTHGNAQGIDGSRNIVAIQKMRAQIE